MNETIAKPTRRRPSAPLERNSVLFASLVATWLVLSTAAAQPAAAQPEASPAPSTTEPSRVGAGFFARTETLSAPSAAFTRVRLDLGVRLRPLEHLAIDVGIGIGGGRMRRPNGQDRATEIGVAIDVVGYLNPRSTAQVFVLGGVGLGAVGSTEQVGTVDPECPSDSLFFGDLVLGAGLEVELSKTVSLVGSTRLVRRTGFLGELEFLSDSANPPNQAMRSILAVAVDVRLIVGLGAPPPSP
ncbi:MAG: hypothetical protein MUE69_10980 [Myxococcota bacterium]|jgi:hypothetical protein|nr:hypothetical protein [Myxococcota bacterium]